MINHSPTGFSTFKGSRGNILRSIFVFMGGKRTTFDKLTKNDLGNSGPWETDSEQGQEWYHLAPPRIIKWSEEE